MLKRPLSGAMLFFFLNLVVILPAQAQASRKAECDTIARDLHQRMQERDGAHEARRMFQARRDPALTHVYLSELRSAVRQERLAFNFLAIAQHFSFPVDPDSTESSKIWAQGPLLSLAEAVGKLVPENAIPLARDSSLETQMQTRLDNAVVDEASYQWQVTPRLQLLRCHELPAPVVAAAPQPAAPATAPQRTSALFNRSATASASSADPHRACTASAEQVVVLEKKHDEAYLLRWAVDDNYHDSFFAVASLRDAHKAGRLDEQFEELARMFELDTSGMNMQQKIAAQPALRKQVSDLMARARGLTGRLRDKWIDPDAGGLEDMLLDDEDEEMPTVDAAVRAREREIEYNFFRAQAATEQAKKRLADLKCDELPPPPPTEVGGSMKRTVTVLKQDYVDAASAQNSYYASGQIYTQSTAQKYRRRISGGDSDEKEWTFSGMPESLAPGQTFTIRITGKQAVISDWAPAAFNEFAAVSSYGLEVLSNRKASLYKRQVTDGQYVFKVPQNATRVGFGLFDNDSLIDPDASSGDPFVRYCYGDCPE